MRLAIREALKRIETVQLGSKRGLQILIELSCDTRPEVRFRVAEKLHGVESKAAREALAWLVVDPDDLVRVQAVESIGSVRCSTQDLRLLLAAVNDRNDLVRAYAVDAIRGGGSRQFRAHLRRFWDRRNTHFQISLGAAELAFGGRTGLRKVLEGLRARDHQIACYAANILTDLQLNRAQLVRTIHLLRAANKVERRRSVREALSRALQQLSEMKT